VETKSRIEIEKRKGFLCRKKLRPKNYQLTIKVERVNELGSSEKGIKNIKGVYHVAKWKDS